MRERTAGAYVGARFILLLGGEKLLEPPYTDALWFIYLVRTDTGVLTIRSKVKLSGNELRRRALRRLKPKRPARKGK